MLKVLVKLGNHGPIGVLPLGDFVQVALKLAGEVEFKKAEYAFESCDGLFAQRFRHQLAVLFEYQSLGGDVFQN